MNPIQLMQALKASKNPNQFAMNLLESQLGDTPMGKNLIQMARKGDIAGIEDVARNIVSSRGGDFNKEFGVFKQKFGL